MTGSQKFHLRLLTTLRVQNNGDLNSLPSNIKKVKIHKIHTLRENVIAGRNFCGRYFSGIYFSNFDPKLQKNFLKIGKQCSIARSNSA